MGIIKRQSIKRSIINYVGVGIGAVSMFLVYSHEKELYGLAQFLISIAIVLAPVIVLGAQNIPVKYFPAFKNDENGHNGFLSFVLVYGFLGVSLMLILSFLLKEPLFDQLVSSDDDPLLAKYAFWAIPITVFLAFFQIITNYISNFNRIVVPAIFNNIWLKIALVSLVLMASVSWIDTDQYVLGVTLSYAVALLGVLWYLARLKQFKLSSFRGYVNRPMVRDIFVYAMYGLLGVLGVQLAVKIDSIMIGKMIDMKSNGAYNIIAFLTISLQIPAMSAYAIASPIISKAITADDIPKVESIYKKLSLNLLIAGMFLFSLIVLCVEDLISVLPKSEEFQSVLAISFFLGLARVFNMATSVNTQILVYSKYFRFHLYVILLMGVLNIFFNYYFIGLYGVAGAALATFLSLNIYNVIKLVFIQLKYKIQPFTRGTLWVSLIGILALAITWIIPMAFHPVLNIALRGVLLTLLFVPPILFFRVSPDLNEIFSQVLQRLRKVLKF